MRILACQDELYNFWELEKNVITIIFEKKLRWFT